MGNLIKETRQAKIIHLTPEAKKGLSVKAAKVGKSLKAYIEERLEKLSKR